MADAYDNADTRPVGCRRCQRRDDATTALRRIAAAVAVGTRDTRDGAPGGTRGNVPPSDDDPSMKDDPAGGTRVTPGRRQTVDASREPGVAGRTAGG